MRADYLDKWSSQFTGGLARLTKNGAVFTNAFQDHANAETAPGAFHSSLGSRAVSNGDRVQQRKECRTRVAGHRRRRAGRVADSVSWIDALRLAQEP
jgi:hypothetical protein